MDPRITFRRGTPGTYYDGVTHAKAEENLIHYSEDFANAYWRVNQITITTGHSSPDGGSTARKLAPTSGTSNKFIEIESGGSQNDFPDLGNLHFAASVFAKAGEKQYIKFATVDTNLTRRNDVIVDLSDGSIIESINNDETQYSVESAGGDWYRIGITGFGMQQFQVLVLGDDLSTNAAGDGTSGIYLWGAQLEQRDSVTSYTATNGTPITKYQPKLMTAAADNARFDHDPITGESKGLLIEESRTNLVQDSEFIEDISTNGVWWNQTATVSSVKKNQTISPTGQLNATKIIYNTNVTSGGLVMKYQASASVGDVFTGSVYLKAGNLDKVRFYFNARASSGASVASPAVIADLSLGVIESTQDSAGMTISDSSIDNVGNGWYRVAMTSTVITGVDTISLGIYMSGGPTNSTAAYDHFFVWGAQMEKATFATSYIKTTGASATRSADNASITGENFSSWYRQDEGSILFDLKLSEDSNWKYIFSITNNGEWEQGLISARHLGSSIQSNLGSIDNNSSQVGFVQGGNFFNLGFAYKDDSAFINTNIASDEYAPKIASGLNRIDFFSINGSDYKSCGHIKKLAYYPQRLTNEQLQNLTK